MKLGSRIGSVVDHFNEKIVRELYQMCWDGNELPDKIFQNLFESTSLRFRIVFPDCVFDLEFLEDYFADVFKHEFITRGHEKFACDVRALLILIRLEDAFDSYIARKRDAWVIKAIHA